MERAEGESSVGEGRRAQIEKLAACNSAGVSLFFQRFRESQSEIPVRDSEIPVKHPIKSLEREFSRVASRVLLFPRITRDLSSY